MDFIEEYVQENARKNLIKAFNYFGIEGTREKIEHLYSNMPKIKEIMLREYNFLIKKGELK